MSMVKFSPTTINFAYDFFLFVTFFGTPCIVVEVNMNMAWYGSQRSEKPQNVNNAVNDFDDDNHYNDYDNNDDDNHKRWWLPPTYMWGMSLTDGHAPPALPTHSPLTVPAPDHSNIKMMVVISFFIFVLFFVYLSSVSVIFVACLFFLSLTVPAPDHPNIKMMVEIKMPMLIISFLYLSYFLCFCSVFCNIFRMFFLYLSHRTCSWPFKHQDDGWDGGTKRWC